MLDAHQLNIFLTAAETLNFTQAARKLHMSQPSVSQHIHSLEEHFGTKLFIRKGRSLALSDAGRTLIPLAKEFVEQSTQIDESMSSLHGQIQGRIIIGCNAETGKYLLPEHLKEFHTQHGNITIVCKTHSLSSPPLALADGTIHFLVTNDIRDLQTKNFDLHEITDEEITLIVPSDHPWADQGSLPPNELLTEQFILIDEEYHLSHVIDNALRKKKVKLTQLDSFLQLGNTEAIVLSVEKGLGVGFASRTIVNHLGNVSCVPIRGVRITRNIYIVRNLDYPVTAAREAFWKFMTRVGEKLKI